MSTARVIITATDRTKRAFASAKKGLDGVSKRVLNVKSGLVGLSGAAGFGLLVRASLKSNDALAKTADKLGITTEALAGLHHATSLYTSVGSSALNEALTKSIKRLGEFNATGGGAAAIWLKKLNLDTQELSKLRPDELFKRYAVAIRGLNDRGQQMAATSALMGDESRQLIGLIDAMPGSLRKATIEAQALGLSMSRIDAAKIEEANDSMTRITGVIKGVSNTTAVALSPYISGIADHFSNAAIESKGFKKEVNGAVDAAAGGFATILETMGESVNFISNHKDLATFGLIGYAFFGKKGLAGGVLIGNAIDQIKLKLGLIEESPASIAADRINNLRGKIDKTRQQIGTLNKVLARAEKTGIKNTRAEDLLQGLRTVERGMMQEYSRLWVDLQNNPETTKFYNKLQGQADNSFSRLAETIRNARHKMASDPGKSTPDVTPDGSGGDSGPHEKINNKIADALQTRYSLLSRALMTEQELEAANYQSRLTLLDDAYNNGIIPTKMEFYAQQAAIEQQHQDKLKEIRYKGLTDQEAFAKAFREKDLKHSLAFGAKATSAMATQNKGIFKINKALALANAAVTLPDAILQSFKNGGGYPWGLIPAGLMAAQGAAQISAIRSASFGGGGGSPAPVSGSPIAPSRIGSDLNPAPLPTQQATQSKLVTINLGDGGLLPKDAVRNLIEQINEEIGDGVVLIA